MRVVKKPITVDAWQLPDVSKSETLDTASSKEVGVPWWVLVAIGRGQLIYSIEGPSLAVTDSGQMSLGPSDWLMRGVEGEIYPCSDSVFRKTYEFIPEPVGG